MMFGMARFLRFWTCRWKLMHHGLLLAVFLVTIFMLIYSISTANDLFPKTCSRQGKPSPLQTALPCYPRWDLMFLKIHKTGSSTVLNILFRYGEKHQLKFAFPAGGRNDFAYPAPFSRRTVSGYSPAICYNIVANHMRFEPVALAGLLPRERFYFTILRQPASLFESSFHYYGPAVPLTWRIAGRDKMESFLRDPWAYYTPRAFNGHYLRNLQFFDLGQDKDMDPHDPRLGDIFQDLEARFSLVMLTEYFDESLILLKELLCWELEDVLYFRLNSRVASEVTPLDPMLEDQARSWNQLDSLLYAHFNHTFWRKVEIFGRRRMIWEVAELRWLNAKMAEACIEGGGPVEASQVREPAFRSWQPAGKRSIVGYNRKAGIEEPYQDLCEAMLTPEMQYMGRMGVSLWKMRLWAFFRDLVSW
uniref:galactosylceramide sulfotransferase-like n=1 Tax=Pristiophorus japonicus TaxID=55135 RepID=UPI00398EA377